jgi:uncharacterized protein YraI
MDSIIIAFAILLGRYYVMKRFEFQFAILAVVIALLFIFFGAQVGVVHAQEPTPATSGVYITVITDEPQINVRMGPSSSVYAIVGTLLRGATATAYGRSQGGDWIQIEYVGAPNNLGWVYSPLVQVSGGTLQVVESPPTPVPPPTSTIDPTLMAQFTILPTSTRLPTFTPPPSLVAPVYTETIPAAQREAVPMAIIIMSLGGVGVVTFVGSLFIRRR